MGRREFIIFLAGAMAAWPLAAGGQQKAIPVVGYLGLGSPDSRVSILNAFREGLNETGYIEGRNVAIEYRWAGGDTERLGALAAELVALKVNVLVTAGGTLAAQAALRTTSTLPIVFTTVGDPVAEGIVATLARPGGNITGLSFFAPELDGKRLELLKQVVPQAGLIAVLLKPDSMPDGARMARLKEAEVSARNLGLRLQIVEARGSADFERAFSEMAEARAGALIVWATPVFGLEARRIAELAAKHRLPAMFESREFAGDGGLMSYGPILADLHRRAAGYVTKILNGAKPADLPVEQPTKFELVINLKTANALGLAVPQSMLVRADEVIE